MIYLDLETRSFLQIKDVGAYVYAGHETTQATCAAYMYDDDMEMRAWAPWGHLHDIFTTTRSARGANWVDAFACPSDLRKRIEAGEPIAAHNAFFERCIFDRLLTPCYGWPQVDPDQWVCTMAAAHYSHLPGKLKDCAKFLGTEHQVGKKAIILKLCKPRPHWVKTGKGDPWFGTPAEYEQLVEECIDDVWCEYEVYQKSFKLPPREQKIWAVDQKINMRGVPIDRELAAGAWGIIEQENAAAVVELSELTGGTVSTPNQRDRIIAWMAEHGTTAPNMQAPTVESLLAGELPADVRRVLEIRQALGGAATNKYHAFLDHASDDDRVRGELVYYGAHTGRWTSKGVQLHNAAKNKMKVETAEQFIEAVIARDVDLLKAVRGATLDDILTTLTRSVIRASERHALIALDYSAIEARGLAWLVGEDALLDMFRQGIEPYIQVASVIFGIAPEAVTKKQRALGKVVILALGYGMGLDRFIATVAEWGIDVERDVIERAFRYYRNTYRKTKQFWYDFDKLIHRVITTGVGQDWGKLLVAFNRESKLLTITLPNGRPLYYHQCEIEDGAVRYWGKEKGKWVRVYSWGGKFTENVVQALCRDLLAMSMVVMDDRGIEVILTVHDEILTEVRQGVERVKMEMTEIMTSVPVWATGFPLDVAGWIDVRYRKD